jgi:hypothetical protein
MGVPRYPLLKLAKHGVLSLKGRVFVLLPWPPEIVGKTHIDPWIEEDQLRAMCRRRSNEFAVAAFNNPSRVQIDEAPERTLD